jgi:hypothetical protein
MATLTAPALAVEAITDLDDLLDHHLCAVIETGEAVEDELQSRFQFASEAFEDCADDSDVLQMGALFIADGAPFVITISEPFDEEAADREEAEYRRDMAQLWAAHGPGR